MSILVITAKFEKSTKREVAYLKGAIKLKIEQSGYNRAKVEIDFHENIDELLTPDSYNLIIVSEDTLGVSKEVTMKNLYSLYIGLRYNGILAFTKESGKSIINALPSQWESSIRQFDKDTSSVLHEIFDTSSDNQLFCYKRKEDVNILDYLINWICKDLKERFTSSLSFMDNITIEDFKKLAEYCVKNDKIDSTKAEIILSAIRQFDNGPSPDSEQYKITESLENNDNSCYMDSALQCLLAVSSPLNKYILNVNLDDNQVVDKDICGDNKEEDLAVRKEIQKELRVITDTIRGNGYRQRDSADELREILGKCKLKANQNFQGGDIQDSGDFLSWLLARFPLAKGTMVASTFFTNSKKKPNNLTNDDLKLSTTTPTPVGPIISVNYAQLKDRIKFNGKKPVPISDFINFTSDSGTMLRDDGLGAILGSEGETEGKRYSRRIQTSKTVSAPGAVIFSIMRGGSGHGGTEGAGEQKVLIKPILPTEEIELEKGGKFKFSAVTVHKGVHYWCYFRDGKHWYYYDDISQNTPELIGLYEKLLKRKKNEIMKYGTVFYYNQIEGPKVLTNINSGMSPWMGFDGTIYDGTEDSKPNTNTYMEWYERNNPLYLASVDGKRFETEVNAYLQEREDKYKQILNDKAPNLQRLQRLNLNPLYHITDCESYYDPYMHIWEPVKEKMEVFEAFKWYEDLSPSHKEQLKRGKLFIPKYRVTGINKDWKRFEKRLLKEGEKWQNGKIVNERHQRSGGKKKWEREREEVIRGQMEQCQIDNTDKAMHHIDGSTTGNILSYDADMANDQRMGYGYDDY